MNNGVICYILPDQEDGPMGYSDHTRNSSFMAAIREFSVEAPNPFDHEAWDYVQIVEQSSVNQYFCGNDGAQGWRHRKTGYTIPDFCRQMGGHPEVWNRSDLEVMPTAAMRDDSPIFECLMQN